MKLIVWRVIGQTGWLVDDADRVLPLNAEEGFIIDLDSLGPHASDTERAAKTADDSLLLESARRRIHALPPIIRRVGKTEKETA